MELVQDDLMYKDRKNMRFVIRFCALLALFFILFSTGCTQKITSKQPASEERLRRLFLEHLMIREGGLYTLLGSKPMTYFDVSQGFPENPELQQQEYHTYVTLLEKDRPDKKKPTLEEYIFQKKQEIHLDFRKLWEFWKKHHPPALGEKYVIMTSPDSDQTEEHGLFINIPNTIYILKRHQDTFKKETGVAYNPDTILGEISNKKSSFWTKVFSNSYLFGILMGYGERNSKIWTWCSENDKIATIRLGFHGHPEVNEIGSVFFKIDLKPSDLLLPMYVSFSIYDETLETYRKERESIIQYFESKDFISTVLSLLKTQTTDDNLKPIVIY